MYEQACQTSKLFVKIVSDFFLFFFFLQRFHSSQVIFTCSKWNCQWRRSDVFSVNFGHISNIFQLFLLLTLNKQILDEIFDRVLNTPLYKNLKFLKRILKLPVVQTVITLIKLEIRESLARNCIKDPFLRIYVVNVNISVENYQKFSTENRI